MSFASLINDTVGQLWSRGTSPPPATANGGYPETSAVPPDVRRFIRERRYCKVVTTQTDVPFCDDSINCAWKAIEHEMALVPAGPVALHRNIASAGDGGIQFLEGHLHNVTVASFYIDRNPVTNADYLRFVAAGGYRIPELWPEAILPSVMQLVDSTGEPGPRFWKHGKPPEDRMDHPVVGVCWYEANAFARWAAKRLPTSAEWQRAAVWAKLFGPGAPEVRYPWGNAFDPGKANLRVTRIGSTTPVAQFADGSTLNGVHGLIGNVWEWIDTQFVVESHAEVSVILENAMAEIRGGAFDTYFPSQATCQFRSGKSVLNRSLNTGFRCCISSEHLRPQPESRAIDEESGDALP